MAKEPRIVIEVPRGGPVSIEGHDIQGPDCMTLTTEIEEALGEVEAKEKKPEYYQRPALAVRQAGAKR